ncbi:hypothetical protein [Pantoea brenneri]|uniref:hypothetical protein n=1 Tax=Pantoea brenneri TaxID=472694 RepID=UPI002899280C|nr:hypothetical protein [Pantoea brenneri]
MEMLNKMQSTFIAGASGDYDPAYAGAGARTSQHGSSSGSHHNMSVPDNGVFQLVAAHPELKDCLNGILGGMVAGSVGGAGTAVASAIGGGIGSCNNNTGRNNARVSIGGQYTW